MNRSRICSRTDLADWCGSHARLHSKLVSDHYRRLPPDARREALDFISFPRFAWERSLNCWRFEMHTSPIIEELHALRRRYAERFGDDLYAICEDARHKQAE